MSIPSCVPLFSLDRLKSMIITTCLHQAVCPYIFSFNRLIIDINIPTVLTKKREQSTQTRCTYTGGMQPTSKKTTDTEDTSKEWKSCTTVRSPYNRMKLATLTEFRDGSMSLSESFDPDDPALIDRLPDYPPETDIGDR